MAASQKEYNMLFKLQAQLGSEFGKTFGSAQNTMQNLQNELRALNAAHGDISAYQKQQAAVEATSRKLADLQQEYDNIQREISETEGFSSSLENKLIEKQRQIDKTSQSLENQTAKLDEMGDALEAAGIDTDDLTGESKKLEAEMKDVAEEMDNFQETGTLGFDAVGSALVSAGIAEGIKQITAAYKECVNLSADFEAAMSQVAATMGVTSEETQELAEFAKEMGATTSFTATEAAGGLNILAMAGLSAKDQMAALPTVLNLAAAGAMDMATSAGYVTGAVKGFSDTMDNAGYYADLMAKGATMANTNVAQLGDAMATSAATASAYGQAADSVTLALLRLAEQNVVGSEAATKLNRAMADIYTPSAEAAGALEELGVAIYDTNGDARDFNDIVDDLNGALSKYSMEQQNAYKNTIFTQNGLQAYNKMVVSTSEKVESFYTGLRTASGSATKQAATQLDNLNGALTIFNSAADGLRITIGEQFQPIFTKIVKAASDVLTVVNNFAKANPVVVKSILAITAEASAFLAVYAAYNTYKKVDAALTPILTALKIKETVATEGANAALLANPYVLIAAGVAALTVGIIALINAEDEETKAARELTASSREEYDAMKEKQAEYDEAVKKYGETSEEAAYLAWQVDELTDTYENGKQTLDDYISEHDALIDEINSSSDAISDSFDGIEQNSTHTMSLVHRLQELASQTEQTVASQEEMKAIIAALNKEVPELALNYDDVIAGTSDFATTIENWVKAQAAIERYKTAQDGVIEAYNNQQDAAAQLAADEAELAMYQEQLATAMDEYTSKAPMQGTAIAGLFYLFSSGRKDIEAAQEGVDRLTQAVAEDQDAVTNATNAYNQCIAVMQDYSEGTYGTADDERALNERITETTSKIEELTTKYNEVYTAAVASISGQYQLWDEAAEVSAVSVGTINSNLAEQATYWANYNTNLQNLSARTGEIEGLSDVIASFADGSADSVNAIAGMASASDADLRAMVANYKNVQEAQKEASASLADLSTEYTTTMDELQKELVADIKAMDLSEEAAESGISTIQGFVNGAASQRANIVAQYTSLGNAAVNALRAQIQAASITATVKVAGAAYAAGTDNAERGVALVGENGPELVYFNGGEEVVPAKQTAEMLNRGGSHYSISLNPTITISGSATEDTTRVIVDDIRDMVIEVMEDYAIDEARRAYR